MEEAHNRAPYNLAVDVSNSTSKRSIPDFGRGYLKPKSANPRQSGRKSTGGEAGSTRKKARKETSTASTRSVLTNITSSSKGAEPVIDYQKAAKAQENFLLHCQDCYPFGVDTTFTIKIDQMIVAQDAQCKQDALVVRAYEMKIVQGLKQFLTEMGDINQHQTICLTPCTKEGQLL
jgi:hypothetical protein